MVFIAAVCKRGKQWPAEPARRPNPLKMKYLQFTIEGSPALLALPAKGIGQAKKILANAEAEINKLMPKQKTLTPKDHLSTVQGCICDHYVMGLEFMKGNQPHRVEGRTILVGIMKQLGYTHKRIGEMIGFAMQSVTSLSVRHANEERGNAAYRGAYDAILEQVKKKMPV
jgi:hypothetical protein